MNFKKDLDQVLSNYLSRRLINQRFVADSGSNKPSIAGFTIFQLVFLEQPLTILSQTTFQKISGEHFWI